MSSRDRDGDVALVLSIKYPAVDIGAVDRHCRYHFAKCAANGVARDVGRARYTGGKLAQPDRQSFQLSGHLVVDDVALRASLLVGQRLRLTDIVLVRFR